jgi:hypothetical protein
MGRMPNRFRNSRELREPWVRFVVLRGGWRPWVRFVNSWRALRLQTSVYEIPEIGLAENNCERGYGLQWLGFVFARVVDPNVDP